MSSISRLLQIMARLRDPRGGCPWDREQTFRTVAPYTIEEAYEVADVIERGDIAGLREELGDLLFQVVFHSQMAAEQGAFGFDDVVDAICGKMERRHPHVFGTERIDSAEAQTAAWEEHKRRERAGSAADGTDSVLANVPITLPALTRAAKLGKRAAQVGFEWSGVEGALDKLDEELGELRHELASQAPQADIANEMGDVLFCVVNVCRYLKIDPEGALRHANAKFERRFGYVEQRLKAVGRSPRDASLEEMDSLWDEGKAQGM
jgi:nucleoside triphosphate diphosphatase